MFLAGNLNLSLKNYSQVSNPDNPPKDTARRMHKTQKHRARNDIN